MPIFKQHCSNEFKLKRLTSLLKTDKNDTPLQPILKKHLTLLLNGKNLKKQIYQHDLLAILATHQVEKV